LTAGLSPAALAGRTILLAGEYNELCSDLAALLAQLGAGVGLSVYGANGSNLAQTIVSQGGRARSFDTANDARSLASLVEQVQAFGQVSHLVILATTAPVARLRDLSIEQAYHLIVQNLAATVAICHAFLPAMLARGDGDLLVILPQRGAVRGALETAINQGLTGFIHGLAGEYPTGRVHVVGLLAEPHGGRAASTQTTNAAAIAAAYLAAGFSGAFHGAVVSADRVLRAVLPAVDPSADGAAQQPATISQALALSQRLQEVLIETDAEFDQVPVSRRPMARGLFASRVGMSPADMLRAAAALHEQLQRLQARHSGPDAEYSMDYDRFAALLRRLADYYHAEASEADATRIALSDQTGVARGVAAREALVRALLDTLTALRS
jgi:NADP-dependent 3-hydroxy acid dehydrogenase YdfG